MARCCGRTSTYCSGSLVPFATAWMGEHGFAPVPTALYGVSLFMPALAWRIMQSVIISSQGASSPLKALVGRDFKGTISPVLYFSGILLSFVAPWAALLCYLSVGIAWLIPDKRIEQMAART
jgi:uncharacterized membrane protein